uniref:Uncharacterized protein n=1 Tax=uncultured Microgenomates bacterium Rifle_16ft_4_minimus_5036 TaxID=1665119 RepID=A0A0H4T901_9BACT|nr:hypothetical protein [uncultured Microgenomates bacterium Rifle_16ft_4_minimus_5036]
MQEKKVFEKGLVKVVWISRNSKRIYSKMFNTIKEAEDFAKEKKDYIIFKLLKQKDLKEFSWEILPYGQHKLYSLLINNYQKHKSKISKLPIKTINIILNKIFGKNV